jgi:hypothetical protein
MKIVVDTEGAQAVNGLLDVALKTGGMSNLTAVNVVRAGLTVAPKGKEPGLVDIKQSEAKITRPAFGQPKSTQELAGASGEEQHNAVTI